MDISEALILEVQNNPILYDKSTKDYKDSRKKRDVWIQVGARVALDGECYFISSLSLIDFYHTNVMNSLTTFIKHNL